MIEVKRDLQKHYPNGLEMRLIHGEGDDGYCVVEWRGDSYRILREFLPGTGNNYT